MSTAQVLVDALRHAGSDTMFGVPGGGPNLSLIGAADAVGIRFVLSHTETSGAISAATYGLLTGRPAMAIATRGPGATSAVNGVAQATLDRYPLVMVTDCVPDRDADRVAHQRVDQLALMTPVTKWTGRLGGDDQAAATAADAVSLAMARPRGAVHLDFDPGSRSSIVPTAAPVAMTGADELARAAALLADARRPVVIAGFECVDDATAVRGALEQFGCPTLTTYQAIGLLPDGHPLAGGLYTSGAIERDLLAGADLIVTVGLDTVEPMPTPWGYDVPVVSITAQPSVSTFVPAEVELRGPLAATLATFAAGASVAWPHDAGASANAQARTRLAEASTGSFGPIELVRAVARCAPGAAIATVDAGAHFLAMMPFWPVAEPLGLLISNGLATMGFALPAAIGAALARPDRPVVCMVGDGGLGMSLAELETIARLRLPTTVIVFDDAALSLIQIKQQPGQGGDAAVRYTPIDFAGVAIAMGLLGAAVETVADLERVLATGWDRPRLIDARIDPAPYASLIVTTRG